MKDPKLTKVRVMQKRLNPPRTATPWPTAATAWAGMKIFFKPTDLGAVPVLHLRPAVPRQRRLGGRAERRDHLDRRPRKHGFAFTNAGKPLVLRGEHDIPAQAGQGLRRLSRGRHRHLGRPHGGVTPYQEVRGYVDAHIHRMAFEFLGGDAHCGKPWDRFGAPYALVDCPDHTHRRLGGVLEDALGGQAAPRPGRLADVQGLAGAQLADPRGHLLAVARAGVARRPADVREPARREQRSSARSTRSSATPATR